MMVLMKSVMSKFWFKVTAVQNKDNLNTQTHSVNKRVESRITL